MTAARAKKEMITAGKQSQRRKRGVSLIELLVAALIVALTAAAAISTWSFSLRADANKRVTEMGAYIGIQQIERMKEQKYAALAYTGQNAPLVDWYDKNGAWLGSAPAVTGGIYQSRTWIRAAADRDLTPNSEDLKEVEVQVLNGSGAAQYEDVRTMLSSGGI